MNLKIAKFVSDFTKNWKNLDWWRERYINNVLRRLLRNLGTYVMNEEWDVLIILDACRYDVFKKYNTINGRLEYRFSRGSSTKEFLIQNFLRHPYRKNFLDTVYVTANPFVDLLLSGKFHKIYSVWRYGWDDNLNTVPPTIIAKESLKAYYANPDKRLIIHFMQPHSPFIGTKHFLEFGFRQLREAALSGKANANDTGWWQLARRNKLDISQVWQAYKQNLQFVLPVVKNLINNLGGKIVVTSDHGNLFGEKPHFLYPFSEFGHPSGLYVEQLVKVPWLIVNKKVSETMKEKRRIKMKISRIKNNLVV